MVSWFTLLLLLALVCHLWPAGPKQRRLARLSLGLVFLFCWMPVSMLVSYGIQSRYSRGVPVSNGAQVIVVLGGAVRDPEPPLPIPLLGGGTHMRCRYAAWLYEHWKALPILVSGGSPQPDKSWSYAGSMRDYLLRYGVPEEKLLVEDRSATTFENAVFSARILRSKSIHRIVLVTDAVHMFRAQRTFERLGFAVTPAPCDFHSVYEWGLEDFLPSARAVTWNDEVMHEVVGALWYRLKGRI